MKQHFNIEAESEAGRWKENAPELDFYIPLEVLPQPAVHQSCRSKSELI